MFYTHGRLNRADHFRKDSARLDTMRTASSSRWLPVWKGLLLTGDNDQGQPHMFSLPEKLLANANPEAQRRQQNPDNDIFLGLIDDAAVFAYSVSDCTEQELEQLVSMAEQCSPGLDKLRFDDLRVVGPALPPDDGALMAYARGLVFWQDHCRFCSRCGHALHSCMGGHVKQCDNDSCNYQSFPRTDPAVIMLVILPAKEKEPEKCLLGRNAGWPPGVFSTLAGFVEAGESLEQAVQREVLEETGIETRDVNYVASQPWPFPRSIMLGFESVASSDAIVCDPNELDDARWFSREQVRTFGTWGDDAYEFQLPRTDSIARMLIERWLAAG